MPDRTLIYDIMFALMACDGRQEALFGDYAPLAHQAFAHSCPGAAFPELWFELPLAGEPWFDLHVLTARETLAPDMPLTADETGGHPEIFSWFAGASGVRQLALSYDLHAGRVDEPGVQLLVRDLLMHEPFLARMGGEQAAMAYRAFSQRLPEGWFACYTGMLAGRERAGVRVECIPNTRMQRAYAADAALLEAHLRQVGMTALGTTVIQRCQLLARGPHRLEFQFDVLMDGSCGSTFSASVRFDDLVDGGTWKPFRTGGPEGALCGQVEQWGLADERWHLLADTTFSRRIAKGDTSMHVFGYPAFLKLRWREGEPCDAKTYLVAGMR